MLATLLPLLATQSAHHPLVAHDKVSDLAPLTYLTWHLLTWWLGNKHSELHGAQMATSVTRCDKAAILRCTRVLAC